MIPLISAIFLASLLGSMHCAAMCGAFMAVATDNSRLRVLSGGPAARGSSHPSSGACNRSLPIAAGAQAAYHLGRLATYTILGTIAGAIGAAIDHTGSFAGFQRGAAAFAGAAMVVFGLITFLRILGVRVAQAKAPEFLRRGLVRGHAIAFELPPLQRAALVGLLTTLLPCGWLYAFVISAAGTGSAATGAITMAVFWLGTLPVMVTLGAGIQSLTGVMRARLPLITSGAVMAIGIFTVVQRFAGHHHELPSAAMILQQDGGSHERCGP